VTVDDQARRYDEHIVSELGFELDQVGAEFHGSAVIVPEMLVPGTASIRTSILATWADIAAGYLAIDAFAPRVPVTLDLDVTLFRNPVDLAAVYAVSRLLKTGQSVTAVAVDFTDDTGADLAIATVGFMAVPDPALTFPEEHLRARSRRRQPQRLRLPFAERARCERREPGVAVLPRSEDGLNSSNTVNGGLIALAVEEAALSAAPGTTLASMAMRYLRPVRHGPAIATAHTRVGVARVEVRDAGNQDRLAVHAVTRTFREAE
jgi:acyl-coenzyme A thioesterase PaaI-like protein